MLQVDSLCKLLEEVDCFKYLWSKVKMDSGKKKYRLSCSQGLMMLGMYKEGKNCLVVDY